MSLDGSRANVNAPLSYPEEMVVSADSSKSLAICEYCHRIVGSLSSFAAMWHVGTGADAPSCCLTEHYLRQQAAMPQAAPPPQESGPINVRPRAGAARGGQTSPIVIVDESLR